MNKVLYVGRKAKGLSEAQVAKVLQIEEREYIELEHSVTDVNARQALKLSKLFNIDAEIFIYTEGRESRVIKYASDEIAGYLKNGLLDGISPQSLLSITGIANVALALRVELNYTVYKQYELEKDNEAIRKLYNYLKEQIIAQNGA